MKLRGAWNLKKRWWAIKFPSPTIDIRAQTCVAKAKGRKCLKASDWAIFGFLKPFRECFMIINIWLWMTKDGGETKSLETQECTTPRRDRASILRLLLSQNRDRLRNETKPERCVIIIHNFESIHSHLFVMFKAYPSSSSFSDLTYHADQCLGWTWIFDDGAQRYRNSNACQIIVIWFFSLHCLIQQRSSVSENQSGKNNSSN